MKQRSQLFVTGFIQVFFVAFNTYAIAHNHLVGSLCASFTISLVWTFNVKKVVFGKRIDQVVYALGAASGNVFGVIISKYLLS